MPTVKENLIAAKALIDTPEKWGKGSYEPKPGCYCAMGSIGKVCGISRTGIWLGMPAKTLGMLSFELPIGFFTVPDFNDHPDTTHDDIMALFDRAIANA